MPSINVVDMKGSNAKTIELNDSVFAIEPNEAVMHQMVVLYLANQRQGTQSALTRSEVSGGGRKPWRQKGTGRARQGSTRSPQWTGGGIVFAPKPRDYSFKMNKKEKNLALKSVLTTKVAENKFIVVDGLNFDEIKTKNMVNVLKNLEVKKALVVTDDDNKNVTLSSRNIPGVKTAFTNTINVYDILKYDKMVVAKDVISKIEEVYA